MTADPFARIPDADGEYAGTELETGQERQRRDASACPGEEAE